MTLRTPPRGGESHLKAILKVRLRLRLKLRLRLRLRLRLGRRLPLLYGRTMLEQGSNEKEQQEIRLFHDNDTQFFGEMEGGEAAAPVEVGPVRG